MERAEEAVLMQVKGSRIQDNDRDERAAGRSLAARHTERNDSRDQSQPTAETKESRAVKRATNGVGRLQDTGETHRRKRGGVGVSFTPPPS